jgi:polysaccharide pyruvyl transferase WcaK-like protein
VAKFVLMDGYCASHVGNDVLLESSIRLVKKIDPAAEIKVHAKTKDAFEGSQNMTCGRRLFANPPAKRLPKLGWILGELIFIAAQLVNSVTFRIKPHHLAFGDRKQALRDYEEADVCISIGGEMISDTFWKILPFYLHMFWLARQCGSKVVVFPQSIGPLKKNWTRRLVRRVLTNCDVVTGRDNPAMEELASLGCTGDQAIFCPDVGVGQPMSPHEKAEAYLKELGVDCDGLRQWIGLTCSAGSPEPGITRRDHIDILVDALTTVAKKRHIGVVILPANMPVNGTPANDYNASSKLYARIKPKLPAILAPRAVIPARIFKAAAERLDAFVSTRMHAAILSTLSPTPTITLNTQRKLLGFMTLVGQEHFSLNLDALTPELLAERIEEALDNRETICASMIEARSELIEALDSYAERIAGILGIRSEA